MLTPLEIQRIEAEATALDQIHALLGQTKHKRGLTARDIAALTGLAVGYVNGLLKASTCVIKRRPHHHNTWYLDWNDVETGDKPFCGRRWRPERKKGRPATKVKVEKPIAATSATPRTDAIVSYLAIQFPATVGHIPLRDQIAKLERELIEQATATVEMCDQADKYSKLCGELRVEIATIKGLIP